MKELSNRECGVAWCVFGDMSNKEIAWFYGTSLDTVKNQITSILRKVRVKDRTGIALWWWKYAIISKEEPTYYSVPVKINSPFSRKQKKEIFKIHGRKCLKCGSTKRVSADHVIPFSQGGKTEVENGQPLCVKCNSQKGIKSIDYRA